jgi:hypothetical protein
MTKLTGRQSLVRLAGLAAAAAGAEALREAPSGAAVVEQGVARCILTPELTEGPYDVRGERSATT